MIRRARTLAGPTPWVLLLVLIAASPTPEEIITAEALVEHVHILASPAMAGRGAGTPGIEQAAAHIAGAFHRAGLKPGGANGYRQPFEIITGVRVGAETRMRVHGDGERSKPSTIPADAFTPFSFSEDGVVEGEVVFAGYGITAPDLRYDDYADMDVAGKVVLVMTHEPREKDDTSPFRDPGAYRYTEVRYKAINAREHGARAIIIVEDPGNHPVEAEELFAIRGVVSGDRAGIVAVNVKRSVAEQLLRRSGKTLADRQRVIDDTMVPQSVVIPGIRVAIQVRMIHERGTTANVIGILPGTDPVLRETAVVVGAHYDHLGLGGEYSLAPASYGQIHPGADDNASGTAAVLVLARAFARSGGTKRTLIFAAFSAEEMGTIGSAHYARHPAIPLEHTVAMINMDMVGRLRDRTMYVFGVGTGKEFNDLLEGLNRKGDFTLKVGGDGYGPSDHTSFYARKVPVLFFFTGAHSDYHRPSDTVDKINGAGLAAVARFVYRVVEQLANRPDAVTYVQVQEPPPPGAGVGYGAYFGSIPDFGEQAGDGVRLTGVRPDSPAARAGLREGDIVVQMAGVRIKNLYDLVYVLRSKRAGDTVEVIFRRDRQEHRVTAVLEQRR